MHRIIHLQSFIARFNLMLVLIGLHVCLYCGYAMMIPILNDNASIIFGRLLWDVLGVLGLVIVIAMPAMRGLGKAATDVSENYHLTLDQSNALVGFVDSAKLVIWSVVVRLLTGVLYVMLVAFVQNKKCAIAMLVLNMLATFGMMFITARTLYEYSINGIKIILSDARRASAI